MKSLVVSTIKGQWLSLAGGVFLAALLFAPLSRAIELPPGFVEARFVGLSATSIAWAPDGALWMSRNNPAEGLRVWVFREGNLSVAAFINGDADGANGIHAIAVDPDYLENNRIWVYYTALDPLHNRLSHFTNVNDILQNEVVILEGPAVVSNTHHGGCLAFAADKTIFLAMGDDNAFSSQDPFDLRGSLIHIDRDGTPAPDNPFLDGVNGDPRVWALGLRNPFRCNIQPGLDNLFLGDVGGASWEEINIGVAGANYGWNIIEGPEPAGLPGFVYPIHSYLHNNPIGNAVIGGDHVEPGEFRPDYEGNYFFGDWAAEEIHRMVLDENNNPVFTELWATQVPQPVDLEFGPDGALYYTTTLEGARGGVRRIEWVGGANRQPTATAFATPDEGPGPLTATLDGSGSSDSDGDPLTFSWDFGDGDLSVGTEVIAHTYQQGVWDARLTVDDGSLESTSPPIRIVSGNNRPTATVALPVRGSNYIAGQEISYMGVGTDPEEGEIPCSRFTWQVVFDHAGHTHPYLGPEKGSCSGSFTTTRRGETEVDTRYRILLTVDDTGTPLGGEATLSGKQSVEIFPTISLMTFETAPLSNLTLTLDGTSFTPPGAVEGVVNLIRRIGAVDEQFRNGHTYRWISWSDGGSRDHEIDTPAADTTFTATFGCDIQVEVADLRVEPGAEEGDLILSWSPVKPRPRRQSTGKPRRAGQQTKRAEGADPCLNTGTEQYRIYAADRVVPVNLPGNFPDDPSFTLVGTSNDRVFTYTPSPDHRFFVVVAVGTDLRDGPAGHYLP